MYYVDVYDEKWQYKNTCGASSLRILNNFLEGENLYYTSSVYTKRHIRLSEALEKDSSEYDNLRFALQ